MSGPDEDLQDAVDDVLESVWPNERRRGRTRWNLATLGRIAGGLAGFFGMSLMLYWVAGVSLPWSFYGFIGAMTISGGVREGRYPEHLREN
jgi:hypothetical protein